MSRRYAGSSRCPFPGCQESGYFEYATKRDYLAGRAWRDAWRCVRHTAPAEVLALDAPSRETRLTCVEAHGSRFWQQDGATALGSGFKYGPGFKAYAGDFEPGTVLVVSARIESVTQSGIETAAERCEAPDLGES